MERAAREPVAGHLALAELQLGGRGRRGRRWQSPFGTNLAMSMGLRLPLPPARLGGFSLAVGLALLDALEGLGVHGAELKWPNDVLLAGTKLAGILIDVLIDGDGVQLIVGVGVNVALPSATRSRIDQPAGDLTVTGVAVSRNRLAGALVSSVLDFASAFVEGGFGAMRRAFDTHHAFQGKPCLVVEGSSATEGIVLGVGSDGELLLDSAQGRLSFAAGEVSLRPRS
jgi:BirA family biotin operon repressor/biotin-[acetyl-CoA-carboxylase] ligase